MITKVLPHSFVVNTFRSELLKLRPKYFNRQNSYAMNVHKRDYYHREHLVFMLEYIKEVIAVKYLINNQLLTYKAISFDDAENFMLTLKIN